MSLFIIYCIMQEDNKEIRQHNALTTARYEMSACEMDIMFCLLSRLNSRPEKIYTIAVNEIESETGKTWNYQQ